MRASALPWILQNGAGQCCLWDIEIGPELLVDPNTNAIVLVDNPMILGTDFTLAGGQCIPCPVSNGGHTRERQHAAFLSALLPLFLLGRLRLAGDGARCFPSLSPGLR